MQKTIFITGATAGFGEACARKFAENHEQLILAGRRTDRLEKLKTELKEKSDVHIMTLDVCDRDAVFSSIENLPSAFQEIEVLINNAGLALGLEPAYATDLKDWEIMVDTNIKGLMYVTRAVLPGMVTRNRGHVVNLGSVAGDYPYPGANVYGSTKAFVKQFSRNLRADVNGKNIRVTNIEPGLSESEFSVVRFKGDRDAAGKVYAGTEPLRPADIADMIHYVVNLPPHVNVNRLEVMATCQAWGHFAIHREM